MTQDKSFTGMAFHDCTGLQDGQNLVDSVVLSVYILLMAPR